MEAAGIVMSAVSLAGLFNDAVESYDYFTRARKFDRKAESCAVMFAGTQMRLPRWGASIGITPQKINDDATQKALEDEFGSEKVLAATRLLRQIRALFNDLTKLAERCK